MKKIILMILVVLLSGCGAIYGSINQYDKPEGNFYWFAGAEEVARIKQDKLAFKKLEAQAVMAGCFYNGKIVDCGALPPGEKTVKAGFKGIVVNLSNYRGYNFIIKGPEKVASYLPPGDRQVFYLLPGKYYWKIQYGRSVKSKGKFTVGPQKYYFMKEPYHWYVAAQW